MNSGQKQPDDYDLDAARSLSSIVHDLSRLPSVEALHVGKYQLCKMSFIDLGIEIYNPISESKLEEIYAYVDSVVCANTDAVVLDNAIFRFSWSIEYKYVIPRYEVQLYVDDNIDIETGLSHLRAFIDTYPPGKEYSPEILHEVNDLGHGDPRLF